MPASGRHLDGTGCAISVDNEGRLLVSTEFAGAAAVIVTHQTVAVTHNGEAVTYNA